MRPQIGSLIGAAGLLAVVAAAGCGLPSTASGLQRASAVIRAQARTLAVSVVGPEELPASVMADVLPRAQRNADDLSRRRKIDFFTLHPNPVGLKLGVGDATTHVLSFLGTSKDRTTLNIEMRALVGERAIGLTANYTGPVTLGRVPQPEAPSQTLSRHRSGFAFDLLLSSPPAHVVEAHETALTRLGRHLEARYDARPFEMGSDTIVFSIERGAESLGYVTLDQRDRLVLGDRKYADVQAVVAYDLAGEVLAGYSLVGFNQKTQGANAPPTYRVHHDAPFPIYEFGDI